MPAGCPSSEVLVEQEIIIITPRAHIAQNLIAFILFFMFIIID
jgi:hypothetical protein